MNTYRAAVLTLVLAGTPAARGEEVDAKGKLPTLVCKFEKATEATLKGGGKWTAKLSEPLDPIIFDSLNLATQSGRQIGAGGGNDVIVSSHEGVLRIMEPLESGAIQVTHVYAGLRQGGTIPAIHSRHSYLGGTVMASQHVGFCRVQGS